MNPAVQLAESGMGLVLSHQSREWSDFASEVVIAFLKAHGPATIDDARQYALEVVGVDRPTSPNAWGALTRCMAQRGDIKRTGEFRQATSASSHARWAAVWEAV